MGYLGFGFRGFSSFLESWVMDFLGMVGVSDGALAISF
jgi:hypothetical protein